MCQSAVLCRSGFDSSVECTQAYLLLACTSPTMQHFVVKSLQELYFANLHKTKQRVTMVLTVLCMPNVSLQ